MTAWNEEQFLFEDYEVGATIKSIARTITEGEAASFNLLVGDLHPYHVDAVFAETEGRFGTRVVAGMFTLAMAVGLLATNNKNAFSYGYDRVRFIAPVFLGDTVYATRRVEDKQDREGEFGLIRMAYEVRRKKPGSTEDALVLACQHLQLLRKRSMGSVAQ
jgi:acyl dehydratase